MGIPRPCVSAGAYVFGALLILLLPLNWLLGWLLAVTVHELGHIIALKCCGLEIREIELGITGARIHVPPMTTSQELICAVAGPACSFLLLLIARWIPAAAVIGLVQGTYNLLPIYPLDGGRMCRAIGQMIREREP